MKKVQIFSIYDVKAEIFASPVFYPSTGAAIRAFADAVNKPGNDFNAHPEDFQLFHVGSFDEDTGDVMPLETGRVSIAQALNLKESQN